MINKLKIESVKVRKIFIISLFLLNVSFLCAGETLSLKQCREMALENNKSLKVARESELMAKDNRKASFSFFLPSLNLMADYTRFEKQIKYDVDLHLSEKLTEILTGMAHANPAVTTDPFFQTLSLMGDALPSGISMTLGEKNNYIGGLSLTQPLFTGGKIYYQYKINKDLEEISLEQYRLSEEEVLEKTEELYYKVVTVREKVVLAQKYTEMINSHLTDLNNMKEAELITDNDVLKAKVKYNEAELNLYKAKNGLSLAKMALNKMIGRSLQDDLIPADTLLTDNEYENNPMLNDGSSRSEIKVLQKVISVSNALVGIERSRYLPNIVLQSNYSYINPNPFNSFKTEFGDVWQISILGQWELFHGNERGYKLSAAKHARKIAELKLDDAREMIQLDIEQAALKLNESMKRIEMTDTGIRQAEDNLRVCNDKFKEGLISGSEVLDAQTLWTQAVSSHIEAVSDYHLNQTKYKKALGLLTENKTGE